MLAGMRSVVSRQRILNGKVTTVVQQGLCWGGRAGGPHASRRAARALECEAARNNVPGHTKFEELPEM